MAMSKFTARSRKVYTGYNNITFNGILGSTQQRTYQSELEGYQNLKHVKYARIQIVKWIEYNEYLIFYRYIVLLEN